MQTVLLNGDCLTLLKDIARNSINLILVDLPYGTTNYSWDSCIDLQELWKHYNRILHPSGTVVLFGAQPFTNDLINSNRKMYKYNWYWKKSNIVGGQYAKYQPMRCIEDICVFYRKCNYFPQGLKKLGTKRIVKKSHRDGITHTFKNDTIQEYTNYPNHLLEFKKDGKQHPTQKPIALLEFLIKSYTREGQTVLDNCMGSGSTGVACVNTNRNFIGMELGKEYFEIAKQRIEEAKKAKLAIQDIKTCT